MSQESLALEEERRRWLKNPGILSRQERVWRSRQKWLEERGYMLRSRYKEDWVPSWTGTKKWFDDCEDGQGNPVRLNYTFHVLSCSQLQDWS